MSEIETKKQLAAADGPVVVDRQSFLNAINQKRLWRRRARQMVGSAAFLLLLGMTGWWIQPSTQTTQRMADAASESGNFDPFDAGEASIHSRIQQINEEQQHLVSLRIRLEQLEASAAERERAVQSARLDELKNQLCESITLPRLSLYDF